MSSPVSNWKIGLPLTVLCTMLWALTPLLLKGLLDQLDPLTLAWCRQIGCSVLMGGYFLWRRDIGWQALRTPQVIGLVTVCTLGLTVNSVLFNIGLQYATPSATQVLGQLGPVMVLIGAVVIFKESFTRQQWFGATLVIVGLGVFFHDRIVDLLQMSSYGFGMLILLIAPLFWSAYALAQKRLSGALGSQQVMLLSYLVGSGVLLPWSSVPALAALNTSGWWLLGGVIIVYLLSYISLGVAMANWEASRVSALMPLTPLFTLWFGHLLTVFLPDYLAAEQHDALSWFGAAVVVTGSLLAALPRRRYVPVAA
jgi:drug/metabolite transporter (DMT)-like permease